MHCFPSDCDTGCTLIYNICVSDQNQSFSNWCQRPFLKRQLIQPQPPFQSWFAFQASFKHRLSFVKLLEVGSMLTRWFRRDPESDHYSRVWFKTNTNRNTISNRNTNICVSVCNVVREETPAVCGENTNTG